MLQEMPEIKKPQDKTTRIWRYMDFAKFVSVLEFSSLYFPRADTFLDPFEGIYPLKNKEKAIDIFKEAGIPDEHSIFTNPLPFEQQIRTNSYVSCWYMNTYESAAMWDLYAKIYQGIAIQSTYEKLSSTLDATPCRISIGMVEYKDYQTEEIFEFNFMAPLYTKRKSFEHENEIRAIIFEFSQDDKGYYPANPKYGSGENVKIDLERLIEKVFISPKAPEWLTSLVSNLLRRYSLDRIKVEQSNLYQGPLY
jgi:hypothetical protein